MFKSIKRRIAFMLMIFAVSIVIGVSLVVYFVFRSNIMNTYSTEANQAANLVASMLDGDRMYEYALSVTEDEEYTEIKQELIRLKENITEIKYMYVVVPVSDEEAVYIYDIYTDEEYAAGDVDEGYFGYVESFSEELLGNARTIYYSNEDNDELEVTYTEYGYLASAYAPVYGMDGRVKAVVGIDYQMEMIQRTINQFVIGIILMVLVITIIAVFLMLSVTSKTMVAPIRLMDEKAMAYASSEHEASAEEYHITVNTGDELQELSETLNHMMSDIDNYIDNIRLITAEKERIGAELYVATRIQADMLPNIFPAFPDIKNLDLYAKMDPAKEVGGDFYDFFMLDQDHIMVVMADVSGKGVPAALFMVIAKTLIKNHGQSNLPVHEVLYATNNQLCEGNEDSMFVTAWAGILELSTGKLTYADAGHEDPILCRKDGEAEFVRPSVKSMPLAAWEDTEYMINEIQLQSGDVLFLYTDGACEATNINQELYGTERLLNTVAGHLDGNMEQLLIKVREEIDDFVGEADQFDDLTMLALRLS